MTFQESIQTCLRKYATFEGRASRSEYWWFILFYLLVYFGLAILSKMSGLFAIPMALFAIAMLVPTVAAAARRLHDIDKSGWWQLIGLIPIIGLALLFFLAQQGDEAENRFGSAP